MPEQDYIFICVSQTGTNIAKAIKFFTRKPYNHVSVTDDPTFSVMYSFCRNRPRLPLPATFNQEFVGYGTLGKFEQIPCEIYSIPVSAEQKKRFYKKLRHFMEYRQSYSYNIIGMWAVLFQIDLRRKHKFVCSQFVAYVLEEIGIALPKPAALCSPEDLRYIPAATLVYRGELNTYCHGGMPDSPTFTAFVQRGA